MPAATGRSRPKSGPSIADVARLAGVSAQTVSRVSTGSDGVRPATRARVQAAMDQLGYSPNRAARALRNGCFGTLGLLAYRFERTGEALITESVVKMAAAAGYSVTLLGLEAPESAGWEHAMTRLSHLTIDGLIIIRAETAAPDSLSLPAGLPVAVSDSRLVGSYPGVVADQVQGSRAAMEHLLSLGHRNIHHIAGPLGSDPAALRAATWQRCLDEVGTVAPPLRHGDWTATSGYQIGQELASDPELSAVYCANDEMAFGLLRALHEHGRRVPADVSVIGFDDIALSAYSTPPLTTVKQDFHRIGEELVRLVLAQLDGGSDRSRERVLVPTTMLVRSSTAAPAR